MAASAAVLLALFGGSAHAAGGQAGLDCNGFGLGATGPGAIPLCTDVAGHDGERAEDNGTYIGHDEPTVLFYSDVKGSGSSSQYLVRLPTEPPSPPTGSKNGPVWNYQLFIANWFGMVLCDTESYPEGRKTCRPGSDQNIQVPFGPNHAGTAFLEMQFYPPGWPPFINQISCDMTHWCASLHINSLQASYGFADVNPNCFETTNFAFLTRSGQPIGPTGPDNFTAASFTPTDDVLLMNPGDLLQVTIHDSAPGLVTAITDLTTHTRGSMVASAGNGWRHILWDPVNHTCQGAPYSFHPMYATSRPPLVRADGVIEPQTWVGWSAHTFNVSADWEIGHFETPDEQRPNREEGPCFAGPTIPGCLAFNPLDSDFDGFSYKRDWPDGSSLRPSPLLATSPRFRVHHAGYSGSYDQAALEADAPAIEPTCDSSTGAGCTMPPPGAAFYPWPHTAPLSGGCAWTMSDQLPNQIDDFGGNPVTAWGPAVRQDFGFGVAIENNLNGPFANPC